VELDLHRLPHEEFGVRFTRAALEPWEAGREPLASMNFDDFVAAVGRTVQDYVDRALPTPQS
jgi:hypothetical protein